MSSHTLDNPGSTASTPILVFQGIPGCQGLEEAGLHNTPALVDADKRLAGTHELRANDFVQLAAAMELNGRWLAAEMGRITLVSADRDLNGAATAEGLTVENPNLHP
ncbi:MAG: hypothetical protein ACLQGP_20755 [Isosphaeraceae bacterium]